MSGAPQSRNSRCVSEGSGTEVRSTFSVTVQLAWAALQIPSDTATRRHTERLKPSLRAAARQQVAAASRLATIMLRFDSSGPGGVRPRPARQRARAATIRSAALAARGMSGRFYVGRRARGLECRPRA